MIKCFYFFNAFFTAVVKVTLKSSVAKYEYSLETPRERNDEIY